MNPIVGLFAGFAVKHFAVDFLLQGPYQWKNKGTLGHPGGLLHSGLHALSSALLLWLFTLLFPGVFAPTVIIALVVFEFVVHYFTDWGKMNLNAKMGWGPNTHPEFWYLLGLDQFIHSMTYVAMVQFFLV